MAKRRIEIEITLKDNRKFTTSLKPSQADVLELVKKIGLNGISKLKIAEALNPEEWGKTVLDRRFAEIAAYHGEIEGEEMKKERTNKIKGIISSRISRIKSAFRACPGITRDEVYLGFPFYCPVGCDRNIMKLYPEIKSIKFLD